MIEVVPADRAHCFEVGYSLRQGDMQECLDMGFEDGVQAALFAFDNYPESYTAMKGKLPIAMWGCRPAAGIISDMAYLWCMTTHFVNTHKRDILRLSSEFVGQMQTRYRVLESSVSPEYEASVRWLRWLGFQIAGTEMYKGHVYYRVVKERVI